MNTIFLSNFMNGQNNYCQWAILYKISFLRKIYGVKNPRWGGSGRVQEHTDVIYVFFGGI